VASNFAFLQTEKPELFEAAQKAESLAHPSPRASCFYARFALEQAVHWLYKHDPQLETPYDTTLGALIHEQSFKDNLPSHLFGKVRTILLLGNHAAHEAKALTARDSTQAVRELFHFLYWLSRVYSDDATAHPQVSFDPALLPQPERSKDLSQKQIQDLEQRLAQSDEMARIEAERRARTEEELAQLKAEIAALKRQNEATPDTHDYNEAQTRDYFIDLLLREAGWDISAPGATEFEVQGMPTDAGGSTTGRGFVDYVLWGDNGLPLGLVEAKRTRYDARKGKRQAELYADCLEKTFGQRPVIFYSNGYEHWIWDDQRYPPRPVHGFYRKSELELLVHRRKHAKRLSAVEIQKDIVERPYQHEAIRRLTESFDNRGRKGLLVMATGTGKTRTAIALVDLLMRADWVKRVLFLADRNALLTQARRAFQEHLPSAMAVDITQDRGATQANVVLSTYPTMLNRIDDVGEGSRQFGPGSFDLVIVDEAHRSIYQKYQVLFEYFDALLVGLTATPRQEVHRDTYRTFELEPGVPTFAYELTDAIGDGHLVPPKGITVPFRFLRQGVTYAELSEEEQEEYEEKLTDDETGTLPAHVDAEALNKWLFNEDTVDKALAQLMEHGLKVDAGNRLGKTILFARNHQHAEFIVERFDRSWPQHQGKFASVIDSHNDYAQSLLDDFSIRTKDPVIAVSVDMLDTGIDVPEVLNLVFFKPVRSRVKFNQMIGRGTRLCKDLLGAGLDKTHFLVFDLCGNFEFFGQELAGADPMPVDSPDCRLVRARLEVVSLLDAHGPPHDEAHGLFRRTTLDALHRHVASMNLESVLVRKHRRSVEEFSERERWERLSEDDRDHVAQELAPLPSGLPPEDHRAKLFDLLCYRLMLAQLRGDKAFVRWRDQIRDLADRLEQKQSIPMVKAQIVLIQEIQHEDYWTDITLPMVEHVRRKLRDLVQFVDRKAGEDVFTNFEDEALPLVFDQEVPVYSTGFSPWQYRKKVEAFVRENEGHIAIAKIKRNQPLTPVDLEELERMLFDAEKIGTRAQFEAVFGKGMSLRLFIRKLVGLDRNEAKAAFARYLEGSNLRANQIRFVETLIEYLTKNGVMDPGLLYEPPFSDIHQQGLDGLFKEDDAQNIVSIVRGFNETVGARYGDAAG
jgi:type I restriction enzyme R subunit